MFGFCIELLFWLVDLELDSAGEEHNSRYVEGDLNAVVIRIHVTALRVCNTAVLKFISKLFCGKRRETWKVWLFLRSDLFYVQKVVTPDDLKLYELCVVKVLGDNCEELTL
jgi:hypothetical protein